MALSQCNWKHYLRIVAVVLMTLVSWHATWVWALPVDYDISTSSTLDPIGEMFRRNIDRTLANDTSKVYIDRLTREEVELHRRTGILPKRLDKFLSSFMQKQAGNHKVPDDGLSLLLEFNPKDKYATSLLPSDLNRLLHKRVRKR